MEDKLGKQYDAEIIEHRVIELPMPKKLLPVKIYFANRINTFDEKRNEWDASGIFKEDVCDGIVKCVQEDGNFTPYVAISFPYVTTLFRWGNPTKENERVFNLYRVGQGNSNLGVNLTIKAPKEPFEVAGPLELEILNQEREFWKFMPVECYKQLLVPKGTRVDFLGGNKLMDYLEH